MRLNFCAALSLILLAACDSGTEERSEVASTHAIHRPTGQIPLGTSPIGTSASAKALAAPGPALEPDLIRQGQERYAVFCTPCHGETGKGDGPVVSRGFPPPASFDDASARHLTPHEIVGVITHGKGIMYPLEDRISANDRWAIAYYVKDLQARSPQHGPASP